MSSVIAGCKEVLLWLHGGQTGGERPQTREEGRGSSCRVRGRTETLPFSPSSPLCRRVCSDLSSPHPSLAPLPWASLKGTLLPSTGLAPPLPAFKNTKILRS